MYPFNKLGAINISFDDSKLIPDPKGELPFWSDSFYYMLLDWCSCIQNKKPSAHLPTIDCGVHIQEIIEKF